MNTKTNKELNYKNLYIVLSKICIGLSWGFFPQIFAILETKSAYDVTGRKLGFNKYDFPDL